MNTIRLFMVTAAAMALMACTAETQAPTDEAREADEDQTTESSEAETPAPIDTTVRTMYAGAGASGTNPL